MNDSKNLIKNLLAEQLGVETTDIKDDDTLEGELHLLPSELSDFLKTLDENGFETTGLDLAEIETFNDLTEALSDKSPLE